MLIGVLYPLVSSLRSFQKGARVIRHLAWRDGHRLPCQRPHALQGSDVHAAAERHTKTSFNIHHPDTGCRPWFWASCGTCMEIKQLQSRTVAQTGAANCVHLLRHSSACEALCLRGAVSVGRNDMSTTPLATYCAPGDIVIVVHGPPGVKVLRPALQQRKQPVHLHPRGSLFAQQHFHLRPAMEQRK